MEPIFIRQTKRDWADGEKQKWAEECVADAKMEGATFMRVSHWPDDQNLMLFEGWAERPDDQGEPRFQFAA